MKVHFEESRLNIRQRHLSLFQSLFATCGLEDLGLRADEMFIYFKGSPVWADEYRDDVSFP
jgi:hypothetical protein